MKANRELSITYAAAGDALYVYLVSDPSVAKTREFSDGIILDFGATGRLVGIEILGFRAGQDLSPLVAQFGLGEDLLDVLETVKVLLEKANVRRELILA